MADGRWEKDLTSLQARSLEAEYTALCRTPLQQANQIWEWEDVGPTPKRGSSVLFIGNNENNLKGPLTGCVPSGRSAPLSDPSSILPTLHFPDYSALQPWKLLWDWWPRR